MTDAHLTHQLVWSVTGFIGGLFLTRGAFGDTGLGITLLAIALYWRFLG
jgi:hypothetical protein